MLCYYKSSKLCKWLIAFYQKQNHYQSLRNWSGWVEPKRYWGWRGWTGSRPANCKPDATRPLFGQILTMFFRNIEPWECSLLFPWFQCVEQKAGAPVWLRLICGPRATSLAVCTIVVLLCHDCCTFVSRLYVVVRRCDAFVRRSQHHLTICSTHTSQLFSALTLNTQCHFEIWWTLPPLTHC